MNNTAVTRALVATVGALVASTAWLAPAAVAADTRTISGVITMPGVTDPLALDAATVTVRPQAGGSTISVNVTSTGAFSATGLTPGAYAVCAVPNAYNNSSGTYGKPYNVLVTCLNTPDVFGTKGTVDVSASDLTGLTIAMTAGSTVSGTVTIPAGADPEWLRGVYARSLMYVPGGFTTVEAPVNLDTGSYVLAGLYPGTHEITFMTREYVDPATGARVTPPFWSAQHPTNLTVNASAVTGINAAVPLRQQPSAFVSAPKPQLIGDPLVGQTLTVDVGEWQPTPTSLTYTWTRGGNIVPEVTGPSYTITAADLNTTVYVSVTGSAPGLSSQTVSADRVSVYNTFTTLGTPTIAGAVAVGSSLNCSPGTWVPAPSFTYKWTRAGLDILNATAASYMLQAADAGTQIRCVVRSVGYPEVTRTSAPVVPLKSFVTAGTVVVAGEANLGYTLTASVAGTLPAASRNDYQWLRNGTAIPGATSATYEVTASDSLATLTAKATAIRSGFISAPATSASVSVPKLFTAAPGVEIAGTVGFGETLTANVPAWTPAATLTYQWLRNGAPIAGAQTRTYVLSSDDQDATIAVRVVGSAAGYASVTRTASIATKKFFTVAPVPTIGGSKALGGQLQVLFGSWSPASFQPSIEWRRDGQPVASGAFYTVTEADLGHTLTVTVTAKYTGYNDVVRTSTPTSIPLATFGVNEAAPLPVISGTPRLGLPLTATPPELHPAATGSTYQWLRNGTAIPGATSSTHTPTVADVGAALTVRATATRAGYTPLALTSAAVSIAPGVFVSEVPAVSGTPRSGYSLKATVGTWTPVASSYSYRWYRNGVAITGATASTYKLTTTDRGKKLTVKVTGKRAGYATATATSVAKTVLFEFSKRPTPTIRGTAKAGKTLTAVRGTWSPTPTVSYQWYRNGFKITGASKYQYKLTSSDKGKKITVKVTAKKTGYATVAKTSTSKTIAR